MAFTPATLFKIAGGGGHTLWYYFTDDAAATVDTAGYFNSAIPSMNIGDLMIRVTLSAGALSTAGFHLVKDVSASAVDVTDALALTVTDTD